jgi:hypothetical protein
MARVSQAVEGGDQKDKMIRRLDIKGGYRILYNSVG